MKTFLFFLTFLAFRVFGQYEVPHEDFLSRLTWFQESSCQEKNLSQNQAQALLGCPQQASDSYKSLSRETQSVVENLFFSDLFNRSYDRMNCLKQLSHELLPDKLESICHTQECPFYGKRESLFQGVKSVLDRKHKTIQGLSRLKDRLKTLKNEEVLSSTANSFGIRERKRMRCQYSFKKDYCEKENHQTLCEKTDSEVKELISSLLERTSIYYEVTLNSIPLSQYPSFRELFKSQSQELRAEDFLKASRNFKRNVGRALRPLNDVKNFCQKDGLLMPNYLKECRGKSSLGAHEKHMLVLMNFDDLTLRYKNQPELLNGYICSIQNEAKTYKQNKEALDSAIIISSLLVSMAPLGKSKLIASIRDLVTTGSISRFAYQSFRECLVQESMNDYFSTESESCNYETLLGDETKIKKEIAISSCTRSLVDLSLTATPVALKNLSFIKPGALSVLIGESSLAASRASKTNRVLKLGGTEETTEVPASEEKIELDQKQNESQRFVVSENYQERYIEGLSSLLDNIQSDCRYPIENLNDIL